MRNWVGLFLAASLFSSPLQAGMVEPVHVRAPISGKPGNGARFLIGESCVTITPFHVIAGTAQPFIRPSSSAEFQIGPNDQIINREAIDMSYVRESGGNRQACPSIPSVDAIKSAMTGTDRQIFYVNAGGETFVYPVRIISYNATEITLSLIETSGLGEFFAGASGSVVMFDGVPVGIVLKANGGTAIARRLDAIQLAFADGPGALPTSSQPKASPVQASQRTHAPFDTDQLPPEYRSIVAQARSNRAKAERIAERAKLVRQKAFDASGIAMQYPKEKANGNGYANFDAKERNFYSGQVFQSGVNLSSAGYGVSKSNRPSNLDDTYYCNFVRDLGCQGPGVVEYQDNPENTADIKAWFGQLQGPTRLGLGYLSWQNGSEAWLAPAGPAPIPGVWRLAEGYLYEGEIQSSFDGRGVMWTPDGKVHRFGVWRGGQPVN